MGESMTSSTLPMAGALAIPAASTSTFHPGSTYADLKREVVARGLLQPQPLYYTFKIALSAVFLASGIAVMLFVTNPWLQLVNAVYMAFALTQVAFLAHDTGHRQIVHRGLQYELLALAVGNLLLGV